MEIEKYFNADFPEKTPKPRRKKKKKKPGAKATNRHAIEATDMLFDEKERAFWREYERRLTEELKGRLIESESEDEQQLPVHLEILVSTLCYSLIRMRRKSRLEAAYGRPADRSMSQDPVAQSMSIMKALGLLNDKKGDADASAEVRKVLEKQISQDSEAIGSMTAGDEFASWRNQVIKEHSGNFEIKLKTPNERKVYDINSSDA